MFFVVAPINTKNPASSFRGGGKTSGDGGFDVNSFTSNFIEMASSSGGGTGVYNNFNENYDFGGSDSNDFASHSSDTRRLSQPSFSSANAGSGNYRRDRIGRSHGRGSNIRYDEQENLDHYHQQYHSHYDNAERRNNRGEREVGGGGARHRHKHASSSPPDSSSSSNKSGGTDQPSSVVSSTTTQPSSQPPQLQQPVVLSLREKRKNNEYESPLASRSAMSSRY